MALFVALGRKFAESAFAFGSQMKLSNLHLVAIIGQVILPAWMVNAEQATTAVAGGILQTDSMKAGLPLSSRVVALTAKGSDAVGNIGASNASAYAFNRRAGAPDHIVVVVEENHGYSQIIGNPDAAYINSLAAAGMLFTNYHAVSHPSEPNYFALFSGSTQGITGDGTFFFPDAPTLAGELRQAGYSFVGYAEPPIDRDHTPRLSFGDSQGMGQAFSQFPTDFTKLPTVSFVTPNLLNDMHDGSIAKGDRWLNVNLSAYANWAMTHNSLLVVTFDEDQGTTNNRVATIVVGDGVGAGRSDQLTDHYALLHTIETLYGLPPLAASATARAMSFAPPNGAP
ncbi:Phosphoesterase family protein [Rhizobiales bacterium GAS113]|nr:Phosphoesterase family protein [Rhizobiales bacterium GAS113]